jgi:hypothetical protein
MFNPLFPQNFAVCEIITGSEHGTAAILCVHFWLASVLLVCHSGLPVCSGIKPFSFTYLQM